LLALKTWRENEMTVINLGDPSSECQSRSVPRDFGNGEDWSLHASFDADVGELLVCGRKDEDCYIYNSNRDSWQSNGGRAEYRFLPFGEDTGESGDDD